MIQPRLKLRLVLFRLPRAQDLPKRRNENVKAHGISVSGILDFVVFFRESLCAHLAAQIGRELSDLLDGP